jgi:methionyl-tRNA formyltransferase
MPDVVILGGTDITLRIADAVLEAGLGIRAIVHVGSTFSISYSDKPVDNVRSVDIAGWCRDHGVADILFTDFATLAGQLEIDGDVPVCLVAGWYHMVPRAFRERFNGGCLGLHASLLPQLRGGAPLNWAILSGLEATGVSLFELGDGVDDGLVYAQASFPVAARAKIADLVAAAATASADLIGANIAAIVEGRLVPCPQGGAASYGLQRTAEDGRIDWTWPASCIDRLVRAVGRPYSGATTPFDGRTVTIWDSECAAAPLVHGAPGQIVRLQEFDAPCVVTGDGLVVVRAATFDDGADAMATLRQASNRRFGERR